MAWKLKKKAQALLAAEQGTVYRDWGGRVSIALVYPNTYAVGMSNLGFQTIYRHLNALPDVVCERVFLPEPADLEEMRRTSTPPQSLESQRPLTDFQLIGFSVTYEGDYVNVLRLLELAGIPLRAADRRAHDPLILMGGVCAFSNPEPIAPFMDFIVVGEGEELVGELMQAYREGYRERETFLDGLVRLEGVYVPERHDVTYAPDGTVADVRPQRGAPPIVVKRRLKQVDEFRTLTMAPEAGTERLRRAIRKAITDAQLMAACDLVRARGIPNLKCYFMIGQPTETSEDVAAIPDLAGRMLERLRVLDPTGKPFGKLTLSISSFVPKPWTPFQWAPFDGAESLSAKLETIKRGVRTFSNVRVLHENPREAALQPLLARGDRRVGDFLELAARLEGDWRRALREWDGDAGFYTTRERPVGERMPWDHFEVGVKKAGLVREWERALAAEPALAGTA